MRLGQGDDFSITYRRRRLRRATKPFINDDVSYYETSPELDAVDVWNGFKILWDRRTTEFKIHVPAWNNVLMEGLLGNFNGDPDDDMIKSDGALDTNTVRFGESWAVPGSCDPYSESSTETLSSLNLTRDEKETAHDQGCKYLNAFEGNNGSWPDPFASCSFAGASGKKRAEYENCLMDVATCDPDRDLDSCLCPSFQLLADYCRRNGRDVGDWRSQMPGSICQRECDVSKGEVFRLDANSCSQSCSAIRFIKDHEIDCVNLPIEGCTCPDGMARNTDGVCINIEDCPA